MSRILVGRGLKDYLVISGKGHNVVDITGSLIQDLPHQDNREVKIALFTGALNCRLTLPNELVGRLTELSDLPLTLQKDILLFILVLRAQVASAVILKGIIEELPELEAAAKDLYPNL